MHFLLTPFWIRCWCKGFTRAKEVFFIVWVNYGIILLLSYYSLESRLLQLIRLESTGSRQLLTLSLSSTFNRSRVLSFQVSFFLYIYRVPENEQWFHARFRRRRRFCCGVQDGGGPAREGQDPAPNPGCLQAHPQRSEVHGSISPWISFPFLMNGWSFLKIGTRVWWTVLPASTVSKGSCPSGAETWSTWFATFPPRPSTSPSRTPTRSCSWTGSTRTRSSGSSLPATWRPVAPPEPLPSWSCTPWTLLGPVSEPTWEKPLLIENSKVEKAWLTWNTAHTGKL